MRDTHRDRITPYVKAVGCLLSAAVNEFDSTDDAVSFLRKHSVDGLLRAIAEREPLLIDTRNGASAYQMGYLTHVAWLLDLIAVGNELARISTTDTIRATPFLQRYNEALESLATKRDRVSKTVKRIAGLEKYWERYIELILALATNGDVAGNIERCLDGFTKRNADRRLTQDGLVIEGTGVEPVRLDFRLVSISRLARESYGHEFSAITPAWPKNW